MRRRLTLLLAISACLAAAGCCTEPYDGSGCRPCSERADTVIVPTAAGHQAPAYIRCVRR